MLYIQQWEHIGVIHLHVVLLQNIAGTIRFLYSTQKNYLSHFSCVTINHSVNSWLESSSLQIFFVLRFIAASIGTEV
jgi:hypothetical protein